VSILVRTVSELQERYQTLDGPAAQKREFRAVVMTMGALHDGHAALMDAARHVVGPQGTVVVTIFVNPRQFMPGEDFARYPRSLEDDLRVCAEHGVDVVLAPDVDEVYDDSVAPMNAGPLGAVLEGAIRPGHFDGVLTVVRRLLEMVDPGVAVFGEKDYQQLVLVRRMVAELNLPVTIVGVPTVRDEDGLALSSRNRYLDERQREKAAVLSRALREAKAVGAEGADAVVQSASRVFSEAGVEPDYVAVTGVNLDAPRRGEGRLLVAASIGSTRLIDNAAVELGGQ
jgi:pantoate--beta-alanine ligase